MFHDEEQNKSIETDPELVEMLTLPDEDIKMVIITECCIFKSLNRERNILKRPKINIYMQVKKQLELDMKQQTGSKSGKEYVKAVYCHPADLTYMQSTSWEMLGSRKHKLESRLLGEILITSDMQMTPHLWQKVKKNLRASWWKWKEREKVGLKLNIQKTKIMTSGPISSWQIDGETMERVKDFIWGAPKSLQMVTAAMKLKDAFSL